MPRHCERSEAIQKSNIAEREAGLPRRFAPRSDAGVGSQQASRFYVVWPAKTQGRQTGRLSGVTAQNASRMPRHCERSEAIQKSNIAERGGGLPRRFAPRSDAWVGSQQALRFLCGATGQNARSADRSFKWCDRPTRLAL